MIYNVSGLSVGNLGEPHRLIVATDGDEAGREAGNTLAARAHKLGWSVYLRPAPDGRDWNDVLVAKEVAA